MNRNFHGLFVGLTTLDLIYLTTHLPHNNEKIVALNQIIASGGPATNAAVTFSYLGSKAKLVSVIGNHPLSHLINNDLQQYAVEIIDLESNCLQSPPVSSIFVTQSTGERAVISINATKSQATVEQLPPDILENIDIILIDGHQIAISWAIARQAKSRKIPIVLDGGSWKTGLESILPFIDYAICSSDFYPPGCRDREDVFNYLKAKQINHIAITDGGKPIKYLERENRGELLIPTIKVADTLGAGDIFHGAFSHFILQEKFVSALSNSAEIASHSCQYFGTRQYLDLKYG
ncbi:MAG: sugar kinase [Xenococcaceae cyanobacterium]